MSNTETDTNEFLAPDRTRLVAERRLVDWVRTALSMIAFGFGIYKVLQFIGEQSKVPLPRTNAPRNVGLALIGIGTLAIIIASVQHWKYLKRLRFDQSCKPWDLALLVASLTTLLGFLLFGSVLFRCGPFG